MVHLNRLSFRIDTDQEEPSLNFFVFGRSHGVTINDTYGPPGNDRGTVTHEILDEPILPYYRYDRCPCRECVSNTISDCIVLAFCFIKCCRDKEPPCREKNVCVGKTGDCIPSRELSFDRSSDVRRVTWT